MSNEPDWKDLALWLLNCEAATLEYLMGINCRSKIELRRHQLIVRKAMAAIELGGRDGRKEDIYYVMNRARESLAMGQ